MVARGTREFLVGKCRVLVLMQLIKKYKLIAFLILQIISIKILSLFPELVERYYSMGFYVFLSEYSRKAFGSIGFSVGDIMYGLIIVWVLIHIIRNRKNISFKGTVVGALNAISVFYFLFNLMWGLNYHRVPLYEKMNLSYEYTYQELIDFTDNIIRKANELHLEITENDSLKVQSPYSNKQIYRLSKNGYDNLADKHPEFIYKYSCIKSSLISFPLSYMGFGGYMNPFSGEAQVNGLLPKYSLPITTLHEMAHQIGYASESEANFIGYLASMNSDDLYFRYAGVVFALRYCLRSIERIDVKKFEEYLLEVNYGILQNFQQSQDFWESYQTPIEQFFKIFYNNFLKVNAQEEGLESYSKFLGLLVSYENKD